MKKTITIILVIISFIFTYNVEARPRLKQRSHKIRQSQKNNDYATKALQGYTEMPDLIGLMRETSSDGYLLVTDVIKASPSDLAGIRKGDIIRSVEGENIVSSKELMKRILKKKPNELIQLGIERNGQELNFEISLDFHNVPTEMYMIVNMIFHEEKICLAIIPGDINVISYMAADMKEQWEKTIKTRFITMEENTFVALAQKFDNFSVVDRFRTEEILQEQDFGSSGRVSAEERIKIGKMLGATHFVIIDISLIDDGTPDGAFTWSRRLIDVDTGEVLCSGIIDSNNM